MDHVVADQGTKTYGLYLRRVVSARGFTDAEFINRLYKDWPDAPKETSRLANLWNWYNDRSRPRENVLQRMASILDVSMRSINPKRYRPEWFDRPLLSAADDPDPTAETIVDEIEPLPEDFEPQAEQETFGAFLRRLRMARGLNTSQLAEIMLADPRWSGAGKSDSISSSISQWERGLYRPGSGSLKLLAAALKVSPELLMRDAMPKPEGSEVLSYGQYLRTLRLAAGFATAKDFARMVWSENADDEHKIRLRAQTVSGWELDHQKPRRDFVKRIAEVLKVSARTLDPLTYKPRKYLPPTLVRAEPPAPPKSEQVDAEKVVPPPEMLNNGMDIEPSDVQWSGGNPMPEIEAQRLSNARERFGNMPQFLKQHVDIFGVSKTDDPAYVRVRFDAILPRKTAGGLMRELVILTTDDLLGGEEE